MEANVSALHAAPAYELSTPNSKALREARDIFTAIFVRPSHLEHCAVEGENILPENR